MSAIWSQSLYGRAIDLVEPTPDQIDFKEIAFTLANINRYAGAAEGNVSVAKHSLIVCDCVDDVYKPYALLHDAHEAYIGDITTPATRAIAAMAERVAGLNAGGIVLSALKHLKERHDDAIWIAAGLPAPSSKVLNHIKAADIIALQTERRDFLAKSPKPWAAEIETAKPLSKVYRHNTFGKCPFDVGQTLFERFQTYLPALRRAA